MQTTVSAKTRVLVLEAAAPAARHLGQLLDAPGFELAASASSAEEGLRLATVAAPDVVLVNCTLDGPLDGIAAGRLIRETVDLPVVLVTPENRDITTERACQTEPLVCLTWPFSDRELRSTLQTARYRHAAERAVRRQREWLDSILRSLGDAVAVTGSDGRLLLLNRAAERLTGWAEPEASGRLLSEVIRLTDITSGHPVDLLDPVVQKAAPPPGDRFFLTNRQGDRITVDVLISAMPDIDTFSGCAVVFRDITERLRSDEKLQQTQRMESLGRLAGSVGHAFNNLLTVIMGAGTAGLEATTRTPADPANSERFSQILAAVGSGAQLAQRLLALDGRQASDLKPFDVNVLLRELAPAMRAALAEEITLELELVAVHAEVRADRRQLEQLVLNLFLNARDAIRGNGRITLRTDNDEAAGEVLATARGQLRITVSDTGIGIPPELHSRVMEPFFTTKEQTVGAGLGLSGAYGIITRYGGELKLRSQVGQGSSFTVLLPLWQVPAPPDAVPAPPAGPPRGLTALLVEDDPLVRRLEATVLAESKLKVRQAAGGAEALRLFESAPAEIDLVVTDVLMPGMNGVDLARHLRALNPRLPILFVSGFSGDFVDMESFPAGITAFLPKPFKPRNLQTAVAELIRTSGL